jgi:hypothetical protein
MEEAMKAAMLDAKDKALQAFHKRLNRDDPRLGINIAFLDGIDAFLSKLLETHVIITPEQIGNLLSDSIKDVTSPMYAKLMAMMEEAAKAGSANTLKSIRESGMVIVPVEPTDEIMQAMQTVSISPSRLDDGYGAPDIAECNVALREIYAAMIAAAPTGETK